MKTQRCNHCMTIQDETNAECCNCGKDDALMYPYTLTIKENNLLRYAAGERFKLLNEDENNEK